MCEGCAGDGRPRNRFHRGGRDYSTRLLCVPHAWRPQSRYRWNERTECSRCSVRCCCLLFLTLSALVANPKNAALLGWPIRYGESINHGRALSLAKYCRGAFACASREAKEPIAQPLRWRSHYIDIERSKRKPTPLQIRECGDAPVRLAWIASCSRLRNQPRK